MNWEKNESIFKLYERMSRKGEQSKVVLEHLQNGGSPNVFDEELGCILGYACRQGDQASVDALLQAGADPDGRFPGHEDFEPPLFNAQTQSNRFALSQALLAAGASPNLDYPGGVALLQRAIKKADVQTIDLLLQKGHNPYEFPRHGKPSLPRTASDAEQQSIREVFARHNIAL